MFNTNYVLETEPFPHIIIRDFIQDQKVLSYLRDNEELREFISKNQTFDHQRINFFEKRFKRKFKDASSTLPNPQMSDTFNSTVNTFLRRFGKHPIQTEIAEVFRPYLDECFIDFDEPLAIKMTSYGAYGTAETSKELLGWHLDRGDKLIAGFVYLKESGDTAADGNLQLSAGPNSLIKEIPAEDNIFVIWPNVTNAWHRAVTRHATKHLRRFLNIVIISKDKHKYHSYTTPSGKQIVNENSLYPRKEYGFTEVKLNERKESKAATQVRQG